MSLALIRKDPNYQKLKALTDTVSSSINLESLEKEARTLHGSRPSRKLYRVNMAPKPLWQALANDMSCRSRLVEINVSVQRESQALSVATDQVRVYLANKYRDDIQERASTVAARKDYMDNALAEPLRLVSEYQAFLEFLAGLIKDIDQTSFALRNAVELLKLTVERPNQVV